MREVFEKLTDYQGRSIRLTDERWIHIIEHPEMRRQRERIVETLGDPQEVVVTVADASVHAYQRFYSETPVTRKYLVVTVKVLDDDAFVITAFYSSRKKKGRVVWPE